MELKNALSDTKNKPIYTAVLVPISISQDDNDMSLPLLEKTPSSEENTAKVTTYHKAANFFLGVLIGMGFSVLGFHALMHQFTLGLWSRTQVVLFALAWSTITGVSAYSIFATAHYYVLCTPGAFWERLEYYFALGVFLGFCAACTVTDVRFGLPMSSILLTLAVAIVWTMLMMAFAANTGSDEEPEHGVVKSRRRRQKGTVLPLVMV